jgi:glycosyltransferase involved in cell wall biosynthesis
VRLTGKIPAKLLMGLYYLQCMIFSTFAIILTMFLGEGVYYSRDLQTIFLLCLTKPIHHKRIYFEAHEAHGACGKARRLMCWMLQRIDGLVVITQSLKTFYIEMGIHKGKVLVVPDGIDKQRLSGSMDKVTARKKLNISLDKNVICYTGHLFQWKGVYVLAESARYLSEKDEIYIVGGMICDIEALQAFVKEYQLSYITVKGYIPYSEVSTYLAAADVLVLPNTSEAEISREYTSPLKLFEYMGARRPIVASDLSSLREMLRHRENAYLVPPDDPKALADGIVSVMQNQPLADYLADTAYQEVHEYTWDNRAKTILQFLNRENSWVKRN